MALPSITEIQNQITVIFYITDFTDYIHNTDYISQITQKYKLIINTQITQIVNNTQISRIDIKNTDYISQITRIEIKNTDFTDNNKTRRNGDKVTRRKGGKEIKA